ncbi:hypothetical protein EJ110_NYTH09522 [Nymphaea thermarum]|nr:hypothetical protein EJ110_NYTH09522 [Nymphaea thermarum]
MPTRAQSPAWLCSLLAEKFFTPCLLHELAKKNEKNIFCLDCVVAICPHCLSLHRSHRLLQVLVPNSLPSPPPTSEFSLMALLLLTILWFGTVRFSSDRRFVYEAGVHHQQCKSGVLEPEAPIPAIQRLGEHLQHMQEKSPGTVPLLLPRLQGKERPKILPELRFQVLQLKRRFFPTWFSGGGFTWSLCVQVEYLVRCEGSISRYLYDCEYLPLSDLGCGHQEGGLREMDDGQMTPSSILDGEISLRTSSSSGSSGNNGGTAGGATMICTATTEFVRRKRRSSGNSSHSRIAPAPPSVSSTLPASSRRKGVPQRSPFF